MKNLVVFVFIFCSFVKLVYVQEIKESSGELLTPVSSISAEVLNSESISSGEGPVSLLEDFDLMNGTYIDDNSNFNNNFNNDEFQSINETLTTTLQTANASTTDEITTVPTTQTTAESTTATSTTQKATITTTTIEIPTPTSTTTTTPPPTKATTTIPTTVSTTSTTSTTISTTVRSTTQRPTTTTTTKYTTTRKTTKMPPVTIPDVKPYDPQEEVPCEFTDKDLICDIELNCFGEGTIDCTAVEDEAPISVSPKSSSTLSSEEENEEYEDDAKSTSIAYFPSELVGRVPPRFSFPWHMKSIHADIPDPLTEPTKTTSAEASTIPSTSTTTSKPIIASISTISSSATPTIIPETEKIPTEVTFASSTTLNKTPSQTEFSTTEVDITTSVKESSEEFSTASSDNETSTKVDSTNTAQTFSSSFAASLLATNTESTTTDNNNNTEDSLGKVEEIRVKRDSNKKNSPSSSESLKLTVQDSNKKGKTCKVTGSLHCVTMPSTAFCRGKGTCKVISVEKTEKSSSSKGVENWAIAVIAICATAAALTIGLLVYLVVTSWKKLKVQPQNGVTTLNYVNSSSP